MVEHVITVVSKQVSHVQHHYHIKRFYICILKTNITKKFLL